MLKILAYLHFIFLIFTSVYSHIYYIYLQHLLISVLTDIAFLIFLSLIRENSSRTNVSLLFVFKYICILLYFEVKSHLKGRICYRNFRHILSYTSCIIYIYIYIYILSHPLYFFYVILQVMCWSMVFTSW